MRFLQPARTAKPHRLRTAAIAALLPVALIGLASCASKQSAPPDQTVRTEQREAGRSGFGGQTYLTSVTTTSTVVSVDAANRTLELKQADGTVTTCQAGPEVGDVAQLKAGDRVKTTLTEERTVRFAAPGAALSDQDTNSVVRPPDGGPVRAVNTRTVTARVLSVSYWDHNVTVQMADGKTMTVKANPYTNLALVKPGDEVSVQVSQARTFVVMKP